MKTKRLTQGALLAAMITLATALLKIPCPAGGYVHLGDAVIIAGAFLLGPFAALPAAVGSALADLLAGYAIYMPATVIAKGCLGLGAGFAARKIDNVFGRLALLAGCEFICVLGGYFAYECLLFGPGMAAAGVVFNLWQCLAGVLIGAIAAAAARKYARTIRL